MDKKAGICWHFKTVQNLTRLAVSTETSFFAIFQANLLNKNKILAIIIGKIAKDYTIFIDNAVFCIIFLIRLVSDQYRLFRFVQNS